MSSKSLRIQNFHILHLRVKLLLFSKMPKLKQFHPFFFHVSFLLLSDGTEELTGLWRNCMRGVLQSFSRLMNLTFKLFLILKTLFILSSSSDPFLHCCCVFSEKITALYNAEDADAAQIKCHNLPFTPFLIILNFSFAFCPLLNTELIFSCNYLLLPYGSFLSGNSQLRSCLYTLMLGLFFLVSLYRECYL